jgi:hypothetical protein
MTPILTIIGFIILYWLAKRLAALKRPPRPMGFYVPPKKSWWQKLLGK